MSPSPSRFCCRQSALVRCTHSPRARPGRRPVCGVRCAVCGVGPWAGRLSLIFSLRGLSDIGLGSDSVCARPPSHRIKSFDSLGSQPSHSRTSKLFQGQYRSLVSLRELVIDSEIRWEVRVGVSGRMYAERWLGFTAIHFTCVWRLPVTTLLDVMLNDSF